MADESSEERPDLVIDEDWKSKVEAENKAIDEGHKPKPAESSEKGSGQGAEDIDPSQIPPASFPLLVSMFSTQAMTALGLIPNPMTGKQDHQPVLAKHYIDLLSVLEEKTKGNLEKEEDEMLEQTLHELRLIYVDQTKKG